MADKTTGKRKRGKGYYVGHKNKRGRGVLEAGMMGLLITCNHRERECVGEGYNILNEYADELYGPEKFSDENGEDNSSGEEDIEAALAKEVQGLKSKKSERRFQSMDSGAKNVIFIKAVLPDGSDACSLVHHIMADLHKTRSKKARHCQRFIPVNGTCKANLDDIKQLAAEMFKPFFHSQESKPMKFCITYKARNNQSLQRDDVISTLAAITMKGGVGHTVDLNHPDLTIIVEIIKNVCCIGVVKDFFTFKKYNLHSIIEEMSEKDNQTNKTQTNGNSDKSVDKEASENSENIRKHLTEHEKKPDGGEDLGSVAKFEDIGTKKTTNRRSKKPGDNEQGEDLINNSVTSSKDINTKKQPTEHEKKPDDIEQGKDLT